MSEEKKQAELAAKEAELARQQAEEKQRAIDTSKELILNIQMEGQEDMQINARELETVATLLDRVAQQGIPERLYDKIQVVFSDEPQPRDISLKDAGMDTVRAHS